jgi:hypothetical protein
MVFQIQKDAVAQIVVAPLSAIVASIVLLPGQALAVPVVPNFTQGRCYGKWKFVSRNRSN